MIIATWNVNSIRTRLDQVFNWLENTQPDLLCLQETKVDDPFFPHEEFESKGYKLIFYGQKSYNGVALISRLPLEDIRFGFNGELKESDITKKFLDQKRIISALVNGIRVVNVYVPNGSEVNSLKYEYKIEWLKCLKNYIETLQIRNEPLCILGDFNIALEDIDIHNPSLLSGGIMASELERESLLSIIGQELQDAFRVFEQDTNHWSWWNYRNNSWERDKGWRIDHIYLSSDLLSQTRNCIIHKKERSDLKPSDHAPVSVDICWPSDEGNINETFEE